MRRFGRRLVPPSLAVVLLGLAGAADVSAAGELRPAPGAPDPKAMVLTSADLGGARVTAQRYFKDQEFPSVISYERELEYGKVGATRVSYVDSQAEIGTSVVTTTRFLATTRKFFASKEARRLIAQSLQDDLESGGLVTNVVVGRPRALGAGAGSYDMLVTARVLGVRAEFHIAVFRVERALGLLNVLGEPGDRVPLREVTRLARIVAGRMAVELAPRNVGLPTVAGTPSVGQTLTASPGRWTGAATGFAYQWQRCSAAGAACTSIAGATATTYLVDAPDLGATLRVVVTARNAAGSSSATSAPTAAVAGVLDTFSGDRVSALWSLGTTGSGPTIVQANGQLEVTLPAGTVLGAGGYANAFALMRCRLPGDFDMQVDYRLLSGLLPVDGIDVGFDAAEFSGDAYGGQHGMYVHNAGGVHGISTHFGASNGFVPDSSLSGTLRLVRTTTAGVTTITASRASGPAWSYTSAPYAPPTSQAANLNVFTSLSPLPAAVKIAYDNFKITSGVVSCPF